MMVKSFLSAASKWMIQSTAAAAPPKIKPSTTPTAIVTTTRRTPNRTSQHRTTTNTNTVIIIIIATLSTRLILLIVMSISHTILPDLNPGDDVRMIDLRLPTPWRLLHEDGGDHDDEGGTMDSSSSSCFCLVGHACDFHRKTTHSSGRMILQEKDLVVDRRGHYHRRRSSPSSACASTTTFSSSSSNSSSGGDGGNVGKLKLLDRMYYLLLTPLTKWDAARFLTLAIDPDYRYRVVVVRTDDHNVEEEVGEEKGEEATVRITKEIESCTTATETDGQSCASSSSSLSSSSSSSSTQNNNNNNNNNNDHYYTTTEQSHAFFPGYPTILRNLTLLFITKTPIPSSLLPATFEATVVLVSFWWNTFCFTVGALALWGLTFLVVVGKDGKGGREGGCWAIRTANLTTMLFVLNPANVFCVSSYSESTFCGLTFLGYWVFAMADETFSIGVVKNVLYRMLAILCWMSASTVRSNGTIMIGFLLIVTCADVALLLSSRRRCHNTTGVAAAAVEEEEVVANNKILPCTLLSLLTFLIGATAIAAPVLYHDWTGYHAHCSPSSSSSSSISHDHPHQPPIAPPTWCDTTTTSSSGRFSLYAHVQRKHWNVGFIRYYTPSQIPNFLLATPVLLLSFWGVMNWIRNSWVRYTTDTVDVDGLHLSCGNVGGFWGFGGVWDYGWGWVGYSLRRMRGGLVDDGGGGRRRREGSTTRCYIHHYVKNRFWIPTTVILVPPSSPSPSSSPPPPLPPPPSNQECNEIRISTTLLGPKTLPYYAVLAAFGLLGATVAHVQISTRMVCSSCPAFYWYMASWVLCWRDGDGDGDDDDECDDGDGDGNGDGDGDGDGDGGSGSSEKKKKRRWFWFLALLQRGEWIVLYLVVFHILGVVMHVNWLPWT